MSSLLLLAVVAIAFSNLSRTIDFALALYARVRHRLPVEEIERLARARDEAPRDGEPP
ncbi:MAG TPA: hypothetical protein VF519_03140 [Mycobacteriales bacterium]|jgi:hypothetical protein